MSQAYCGLLVSMGCSLLIMMKCAVPYENSYLGITARASALRQSHFDRAGGLLIRQRSTTKM